MPRTEYLECGKIINTHGVRGDVKVESYCDSTEILKGLSSVYLKEKDGYRELRVCHASIFKAFVLMSLEGITTLDEAVMMREKILYARREDIPVAEGSYFIADLIGLPVIDADDRTKVYGTLKSVQNLGASDIYTVQTEKGERMMPAVSEFVISVELDEGIYVRPIEGMLD
jgi:16S rRNA processing protein RimM